MIDYLKIGAAVDFYGKMGYKYIEVPWVVPNCISSLTKPAGARNIMTDLNGNDLYSKPTDSLVASGEQSFLDMIHKDQLTEGKFCCVTPCFRDDQEDFWHSKYFMKVELIHINTDVFTPLMLDATNFLKRYVDGNSLSYLKVNYDQCDILGEMNRLGKFHIELGSYGTRTINWKGYKEKLTWSYGTGLAEPRFSNFLSVMR